MELLRILSLNEAETTTLNNAGKLLNQIANTEKDGLSQDTEDLLVALQGVLEDVLASAKTKKL